MQLTAANTDAEVDTLIAALEELAQMGELQPAKRRADDGDAAAVYGRASVRAAVHATRAPAA